MKITCTQFEGLISFYLNGELSEKLKTDFEAHLKSCPSCHIRYNVLNTIIAELKEAYNKFITEENEDDDTLYTENDETEDDIQELSAYIDNELNDEFNIKMRRNIIARPKLRKKLEKLYNLRKIMTSAFADEKNKLRTDYSKSIAKNLNSNRTDNHVYFYCLVFIMFVIGVIFISSAIIFHMV